MSLGSLADISWLVVLAAALHRRGRAPGQLKDWWDDLQARRIADQIGRDLSRHARP